MKVESDKRLLSKDHMAGWSEKMSQNTTEINTWSEQVATRQRDAPRSTTKPVVQVRPRARNAEGLLVHPASLSQEAETNLHRLITSVTKKVMRSQQILDAVKNQCLYINTENESYSDVDFTVDRT